MYNFNKLNFYVRAKNLSIIVYEVTEKFPLNEKYLLVDQMRRAVDSIVSNIAEGGGRETNAEISLFLRYVIGSCNELESQVDRSMKIGYIKNGKIINEIVEIRKMVLAFKKRFSGS